MNAEPSAIFTSGLRADERFDAVVVGAGVAGSLTAALLARRGHRVLLVEKSAWPREKVCGGCLSASALAALRGAGVHLPAAAAEPLDHVCWHVSGRNLRLPIPRGAAILRRDLDTLLVDHAIACGVEFRSECSATLFPADSQTPYRVLRLRTADAASTVQAAIVVAADGIGGTLLASEDWARWNISPRAFIGAAATLQCQSPSTPPGEIHMHAGKGGYVGLVRIDAGHHHLAAALDPVACRGSGGPANLIQQILRSCHRDLRAEIDAARFKGVGVLTRSRSRLGGFRVLAVGDACGYVEPFTGEGMAWAAQGAAALVPLLGDLPAVPADLPARWRRKHLEIIGRQQRFCRAMRPTMHHPALAAAGIFMGSAFPVLAAWIAKAICRPPNKEILDDLAGRFRLTPSPRSTLAGDPRHRHRPPDSRSPNLCAGTGPRAR